MQIILHNFLYNLLGSCKTNIEQRTKKNNIPLQAHSFPSNASLSFCLLIFVYYSFVETIFNIALCALVTK